MRPAPHLVATIAIWAVALGAVASAQLFGPSSVPSGHGANGYKALPEVWLRLSVEFASGPTADAAVSVAVELTMPTASGERLLGAARLRSPADLTSITRDGRLPFQGVPAELPVQLRISIRRNDDRIVQSYIASHVLEFPGPSRSGQVGPTRALEEAAFLGDFFVDIASATITRKPAGSSRH